MAEDDQKTSTADTGTEDQDKSTATGVEDQQPEPSEDKATSAGEEDDKGTEDEDQGADEDEGEGSAPSKNENKLAYQIRQLSSNNPLMSRLQERVQPWVDNAEDAAEKRDRQRDVNEYIREAARAQDDIKRDNEVVVREIGLFNPNSPDYNQALTQRAYAQYARDMAVEDQNGAVDGNGNPIIVGYRMRLVDFMREKAEDFGFQSKKPVSEKQPGKPQSKSKNAKAQMDAAADSRGGSSNSTGKDTEKKDPFLEGFDNPYGRHAPAGAHDFSRRQ